jgi:hypothetical protein
LRAGCVVAGMHTRLLPVTAGLLVIVLTYLTIIA